MTERFWDRSAPYGVNGYSYGRGEWVDGEVSQSVQFKMRAGDQCIARGVMEMTDGRLYTWTVRAERHADMSGHRRLATLMRSGTFAELSHSLFAAEESRIDPDRIAEYRAEIDAL
jgi:hypothetical protein